MIVPMISHRHQWDRGAIYKPVAHNPIALQITNYCQGNRI